MKQSKTNTTSKSKGILSGIRVIQFGGSISAPLAGLLLGEQGASVLHIVEEGYETANPILDAILARGKDQISIDFSHSDIIPKIKDLIKRADIIISNWDSEKLEEIEINLNDLQDENPHLIVCEITPFAPWDERNETIQPYEAAVGMAALSYNRALKTPYYHSFPIGSVLSALYGVSAIVASLYARDQSGVGEFINVNLFESTVFSQVLQVLVLNGAPRSFMPLKMIGSPFMGVWECKDGRYIYLHITIPQHNADILELIRKNGFEEEIDELQEIMSDDTREDPSMVKDIPEAKGIKRIMGEIYKSKTADEWEKLLGRDFCCIKVRNLEEWVMESVESNNQDCKKIPDPIFGKLYAPGPAVMAGNEEAQIGETELEERTINKYSFDDFLGKWNKDHTQTLPETQENHTTNSKPLEGVKVFDMSRVIAGPFSARILAELGADVVSVQRPKRLDWALSFHVIFNSGKDSVTLDFAKDEGKELLWQFMKDYSPNVFLQNYRNIEFSREIGFGYEDIQKKIPGIVYTYVNAYGIEGEWQERPAFEQVVQAVTGIQMEYVQGKKPRIFPSAILDMGSGLISAYSALLGLYKQRETGVGGFCHAHMTSTAMFLQINRFPDFQLEKLEELEKYQKSSKDELPFVYKPDKKIKAIIMKILFRWVCLCGPKSDLLTYFEESGLVKDISVSFEEQVKQCEKKCRWYPLWLLKKKIKMAGLQDSLIFVKREQLVGFVNRYIKKDQAELPFITKKKYPSLTKLSFLRTPIHLTNREIVDLKPAPLIGQQTRKYLEKYVDEIEDKKHILDYPEEKPLLEWLWSFIVWGIYAIRSGNF